MNNTEIRLSILCQYYKADFNGKGYGSREKNPEIRDVPKEILNANLGYLIEKKLINGKKIYFGRGIVASPTDITDHGIDVVESIMENSLDQLDTKASSDIKKEDSTSKRLEMFYEMCVKAPPMCEIAVKVTGAILENL